MCASVKPVMSQLGTRRQTNGRSLWGGAFRHSQDSFLTLITHSKLLTRNRKASRPSQPAIRCRAHDPKDLPVPPPEVKKSPANRRAGPAHSAPRAARWLSRSTAPIAFDRRGSGGTRGARGRRSGRLDTRAAARLTEAGTRGRSGNGGDRRTRPRTPRAMAARTARPALGVGALEESAAAGAARYEVRLRDTRPRAAMRVARTRPRRVPPRAGGGKRRASGARARVAAPDLAASRPTADANPAPPPLAELIGAESRAPEGASRAALPRARRRGARPARAPRHPRPLAATRVRSLTIHHPPRAHPSAPRAVAHRPGGGHHPRGRVHTEGDGVQRRSGELLRRPAQGTRAAATRPVGAPRVRPSRRRSKNGGGWRLAATRTRRKSFRRFEEPSWRRSIRYSIARTHDRPSPPKDYENPPSGAFTPLRRAARLTLPTPPRAPADPDPTPPPAAPPAAHQGLARYAPDPTNPRTPRTTFPRPKQRDQNRPRNAVVDLSFSSARLYRLRVT